MAVFGFQTGPGAQWFGQQQPQWLRAFRPGFPLTAALVVGGAIVVVPLFILAVAGLVVGATVYFVLNAIASVIRTINVLLAGGATRSSPPETETFDDGRRNVRIIHRD